jgi:co-chaperonin GroES (HSP10)
MIGLVDWPNPDRRTFHEIPSAARSCRAYAYRCRGKNPRRHHHSRHREGKPQEGRIVAVGPGGRDETGKLIPMDVKVGDRVLFGKWSGTEVRIGGVEYLIMKESDILGVLTEAEAKKKAA